jgi:hypothetical protein
MARDISRFWKIIQSNGDSWVFVGVHQQFGPLLEEFSIEAVQIANEVRGSGNGFVNGDSVFFTIVWDNNTAGSYQGAFDAAGRINGSTFDLRNPSSVAGWHSDKTF